MRKNNVVPLNRPDVTISEFLENVFAAKNEDELIWLAAFEEDPKLAEQNSHLWKGKGLGETTIEDEADAWDMNVYFSIATFRKNAPSRTKRNFSRLFLVGLDDTKSAPLEPSYRICTSPGKYHLGYLLDEPLNDRSMADTLARAVAQVENADASGNNMTRYLRLPRSMNTKKGSRHPVVLEEWHPERRYTVQQLVDGLGLDLTAANRDIKNSGLSEADWEKLFADKVKKVGHKLRPGDEGRHALRMRYIGHLSNSCVSLEQMKSKLAEQIARYFDPEDLAEVLDKGYQECENIWFRDNGGGPAPDAGQIPDITPLLPSAWTSIVKSAESIYPLLAATKRVFWHADAVAELDNSNKKFSRITPDQFKSRTEHYAGKKTRRYYKGPNNGPEVLRDSVMTNEAAKALLATKEAYKHLPPVRLLTKAPLLMNTSDGLLLAKPGYNDIAGGVYVACESHVEDVPLDKAVAAILGLFKDYNFVVPADKSRAVAMLMTPELQAGGFIVGACPVLVVEADKSQGGKTLQLKMRGAVYNDELYTITVKDKGVGSLDESLSDFFLSGARFGGPDNVRGRIDSQMLEAAITSPENVLCRVPFRPNRNADISAVSIGMTSNGVELTRDQANRVCIVRIQKQPRDYQFDMFADELINHVKENFSFYLGCIHTVIRYWADAGMPREKGIGHDFKNWAGTVQWICQQVFGLVDPMRGHEALQQRTSSPVVVWLRSVCLAVEAKGKLDEGLLASEIGEILLDSDQISWPRDKVPDDRQMNQAIGRHMKALFDPNQYEVKERGDQYLTLELEGYVIERLTQYSDGLRKDIYSYRIFRQ